jgi:hypothetical protein
MIEIMGPPSDPATGVGANPVRRSPPASGSEVRSDDGANPVTANPPGAAATEESEVGANPVT